jgi:hypothetical protein
MNVLLPRTARPPKVSNNGVMNNGENGENGVRVTPLWSTQVERIP